MNYSSLEELLLKLNFNVNSIGFRYWIDAIQLYKENYYKHFKLYDIYEILR